MKTRMKSAFGSLVFLCGVLGFSGSALAQHATNYGITGVPGVIEQQTAPTLVSDAEWDYTVQTIKDGPDTDILVTRTERATGAIDWSFQYGDNNVDEVGFSMVRGLPGTLIIVGHRNELGQQVDNYVLCISDAGLVQWDLQFGNSGAYESSRLIIDAKGVASTNAFVVAGVTHTNTINNLVPTAYAIDGWGNLLWHARYGDGTSPATFQYYLPTSMLINEHLEVVIAGQVHNAGGPTEVYTMGINTIDGGLLPTGLIYYDILGDVSEEQYPSIIRAENNQGYAMSFHSKFTGGAERIGLLRLDNNRAQTWTQIHWVNGAVDIQRPITLSLNGASYEMSLFLKDGMADLVGNPALLRIQLTGNYILGRRYSGFTCEGVQSSIREFGGDYLGRVSQTSPAIVYGLYRTDAALFLNSCTENIPGADFSQFASTTIPHPMDENLDYDITEATPGLAVAVPPIATQTVCPPPPPVPAEATSMGEPTSEQSWVNVFPNPSTGSFTMSVDETALGSQVQVLDALGRVVYHEVVRESRLQIDLGTEAKGFYTLMLQNGDEVQSQKLLIE